MLSRPPASPAWTVTGSQLSANRSNASPNRLGRNPSSGPAMSNPTTPRERCRTASSAISRPVPVCRIAEDIEIDSGDTETTFVTLGPVAQWVKDRQIALELSPTSNLQTGAVAAWGDELIDHPFDLLYQLGFRVTVNTDNRLMSDTTLTRELFELSETFGYDIDDLENFQLNAVAAAFLPLEDREELADIVSAGFDQA